MPDAEKSINDQETMEIESPDMTPDPEGGEMELVMEDPFNPSEINIISKVDTLRNLIERLKFDEIDMNPDFQRHAELWDNSKNAMTKPIIRKFLEELAGDEYLKKAIGDQSKRMVDQELVLRFLSFQFMDYEKSKKNLATFLDEMVNKLEKSSPDERETYKNSFHKAIKRCWIIFQEAAFEKSTTFDSAKRRRKNSTLFEVWTNAMAGLSEKDINKLIQNKDLLNQKHLDLMVNDNDYFRSITYSTQKKDHFRTRKTKVAELIKEILNA